MALADDLLDQGRRLAALGTGRPRQADLRRAVSSAYYALFHLLVQDAARRISPGNSALLAQQVARAFAHGEMKQACNSVAGNASVVLLAVQPLGFSEDLRFVAREFVTLQEKRHDADYDMTQTYTRIDVLDVITRTQTAFSTWNRIRQRAEADIFCAALLLHRSWGK